MKEQAEGRYYKPGQVVPRTGVYKVYHRQHRLMHEAALIENTLFPRCKKCKAAVRFALARSVPEKFVLPFRSTELLEESQEPQEHRSKAG